MGLLNRNAILAASDIQQESVEVPEWGGSVIVRGLTGAQRDRFEASMFGQRQGKPVFRLQNLRAQLVMLSVVDEQGKQLFDESDVMALGQKSAAALQRIWNVAQRLSGLTEADVEELTKNSESDQSASSTSA